MEQTSAMDFDGDGQSNRDESRAGTDPTNTGSVFEVLTVTLATQPWPLPARMTVLWSAIPARTYRVQAKPVLDAPWQDIVGDVIALTTSASKTFDVPSPPRIAFFRAALVP